MRLPKEKILEQCFMIRQDWVTAPDTFPSFLKPVGEERRLENEALVRELLEKASPLMKASPSGAEEQRILTDKVNLLFDDFCGREHLLNIRSLGEAQIDACRTAMQDFLEQVRGFDRSLPKESAAQAFRNYTVYLMFLLLHGLTPRCSPAILGYSLLYPYTDNFLDGGQSDAKKQSFNRLIRSILEGRPVRPSGRLQRRTASLLEMIDSVYDRASFPEVTDSLLLIYEAQLQSMLQRGAPPEGAPSEGWILDTSIFKGGASVLADRCLVPKRLTEEEIPFYLGFGFFLQLVDDLQDIEEDRREGGHTLFTRLDTEKAVNKAFHFLHGLFQPSPTLAAACPDGRAAAFLTKNCYLLLFSCILMQEAHFTESYLEQAGPFLPVSLSFSRRLREEYGALFAKLL